MKNNFHLFYFDPPTPRFAETCSVSRAIPDFYIEDNFSKFWKIKIKFELFQILPQISGKHKIILWYVFPQISGKFHHQSMQFWVCLLDNFNFFITAQK